MHTVDRIAELRAEIAVRMAEYRLLRAEVLSNRVGRVGANYEVVLRHHLVLKERPLAPTSISTNGAGHSHSDGHPVNQLAGEG